MFAYNPANHEIFAISTGANVFPSTTYVPVSGYELKQPAPNCPDRSGCLGRILGWWVYMLEIRSISQDVCHMLPAFI